MPAALVDRFPHQACARAFASSPRCRASLGRGAPSLLVDFDDVMIDCGVVVGVRKLAWRIRMDRAKRLSGIDRFANCNVQIDPSGLVVRCAGKLGKPCNLTIMDA